MISKSKIDQIKKLRKDGLSHRDIVKKLEISLGSVFNHSRDIVLTDNQKFSLKMRGIFQAPFHVRREWSIRGGNQTKYRVKYTSGILIGKIRAFVDKNGRIPLKREFGGHYYSYRRVFGTWNNAIKTVGFDPNPVLFAKKYVAKDGHKCDSLAEKIIDDWLSRRKINHKRNYPYPSEDKFTVDFLVGKYWIEFFGLRGQLKSYDDLIDRKIRLAKEKDLMLVRIYPEDLFPKGRLNKRLKFLLQ